MERSTLNTIIHTTADTRNNVAPEAACPVCRQTVTNGSLHQLAGYRLANYMCVNSHIFTTRWLVIA